MDVSITSLDQSSLISTAISKDFQLMTFRNYPGLDPDNNYVWWYGAGNPVNFSGFDDPDVNRLLDAGRATPDPATRQQIYGELNTAARQQGLLPVVDLDHVGRADGPRDPRRGRRPAHRRQRRLHGPRPRPRHGLMWREQ